MEFPAHFQALEYIINQELENGFALEPGELVLHFEWLLRRDAETLKAMVERSDAETARLTLLESRLLHLESTDYRKWQKGQIMRKCRYAYLKPHRQIKITFEEETKRCHHTWKQFDFMQHQALSRDEKVLKNLVIDPAAWRSHVDGGNLVVGFSDQVPWWGFLQTPRQMYSVVGFVAPPPSQFGCHYSLPLLPPPPSP